MSGISSQGLILSRGNGASPEVFTAVTQVTGTDGPSRENPEIDVTDLSATAKQFISGLLDNGEFSFDLNFDPKQSTHDAILDDQEARTIRNWRITWPVSPTNTWTFPAYVKTFAPRSAVDAAITASGTLRVTGVVTRAP